MDFTPSEPAGKPEKPGDEEKPSRFLQALGLRPRRHTQPEVEPPSPSPEDAPDAGDLIPSEGEAPGEAAMGEQDEPETQPESLNPSAGEIPEAEAPAESAQLETAAQPEAEAPGESETPISQPEEDSLPPNAMAPSVALEAAQRLSETVRQRQSSGALPPRALAAPGDESDEAKPEKLKPLPPFWLKDSAAPSSAGPSPEDYAFQPARRRPPRAVTPVPPSATWSTSPARKRTHTNRKMLTVHCPSCRAPLHLSREHLGVEGECPHCQTPIVAFQSQGGETRIMQVPGSQPRNAPPAPASPAAQAPPQGHPAAPSQGHHVPSPPGVPRSGPAPMGGPESAATRPAPAPQAQPPHAQPQGSHGRPGEAGMTQGWPGMPPSASSGPGNQGAESAGSSGVQDAGSPPPSREGETARPPGRVPVLLGNWDEDPDSATPSGRPSVPQQEQSASTPPSAASPAPGAPALRQEAETASSPSPDLPSTRGPQPGPAPSSATPFANPAHVSPAPPMAGRPEDAAEKPSPGPFASPGRSTGSIPVTASATVPVTSPVAEERKEPFAQPRPGQDQPEDEARTPFSNALKPQDEAEHGYAPPRKRSAVMALLWVLLAILVVGAGLSFAFRDPIQNWVDHSENGLARSIREMMPAGETAGQPLTPALAPDHLPVQETSPTETAPATPGNGSPSPEEKAPPAGQMPPEPAQESVAEDKPDPEATKPRQPRPSPIPMMPELLIPEAAPAESSIEKSLAPPSTTMRGEPEQLLPASGASASSSFEPLAIAETEGPILGALAPDTQGGMDLPSNAAATQAGESEARQLAEKVAENFLESSSVVEKAEWVLNGGAYMDSIQSFASTESLDAAREAKVRFLKSIKDPVTGYRISIVVAAVPEAKTPQRIYVVHFPDGLARIDWPLYEQLRLNSLHRFLGSTSRDGRQTFRLMLKRIPAEKVTTIDPSLFIREPIYFEVALPFHESEPSVIAVPAGTHAAGQLEEHDWQEPTPAIVELKWVRSETRPNDTGSNIPVITNLVQRGFWAPAS